MEFLPFSVALTRRCAAGDLCDANAITHLIKETQPDEIYNLAAQSHVAVSFKMPMYTADVNATGTLILLEAVRLCGLEHKTRFYQVRTVKTCVFVVLLRLRSLESMLARVGFHQRTVRQGARHSAR